MFAKGVSGNPKGRPKGSKDRKWSRLPYWFEMLESELNKKVHVREYFKNGTMYREFDRDAVDPNTRARLFMEGMKMIVSRMRELPKDSEESVTNTKAMMDELAALEKSTLDQFKRSSDSDSVEDGKAKVQAKPAPEGNQRLAE